MIPINESSNFMACLYNKILLDIINEVPGVEGNAHILSFKDIGLDKICTKEKLQRLEEICNSVSDTSKWDNLFEQAGVYDLAYFTYFLRSNFVIGTIVPETSIQYDDLSATIDRFSPLHGRVFKSLNRYINYEFLTFISCLHIYYNPRVI